MNISMEVLEAYAKTYACIGAVVGLCFVVIIYIVDYACITISKKVRLKKKDRIVSKLNKKANKRLKYYERKQKAL